MIRFNRDGLTTEQAINVSLAYDHSSNLFRPFGEWLSGKSILEVGTIAGSSTSYLCSISDNMTAIPSDKVYKNVISERCRNVCMATPDSVKGKFDAVIILDATYDLISRYAEFVCDNGVMFVCRDNDFSYRSIIDTAIAGIYSKNSVHRFLHSVGFSHAEQYIPIPNYKNNIGTITPLGIHEFSDKLSGLAAEAEVFEPFMHFEFSPEKVTQVIYNSRSPDILASSLFFIASRKDVRLIDGDIAAVLYSNRRKKEFQKVTKFIKYSDGKLAVIAEKIC